jgi:RND family efflux transporter MFP subunit
MGWTMMAPSFQFQACKRGIIAALALVAGGCDPKPAEPAAPPTKPPERVAVIQPQRKTITRTIEQPGTIEAFEQTPLHAKIPGFVKEVRVDISDIVKANDVLAELSVPEMDEELKQKEALTAQARAEIQQAEAALAAADANLKTAGALVKEAEAGRLAADALVARWKSELTRLEKAKNSIDAQTVEETRYQTRAAEATREEVEAKVLSRQAARDESAAKRAKAEADVSAAKARLGVAEADQRRMAALVEYAKIRAPYNGVVTRRNVDTGAFLQPASSGRGEALLVVMRTDKVRIFMDVPQTAAPYIGKDTVARVRIQALGGREFKGTVARTSWALDPKAFTLRTEIDLPNADAKLRPGMYANATLLLTRDNVLTLPATALVTQGDRAFCYRLVDGKPLKTPVQVGLSEGGIVEVVKKLVSADTWEDFTGDETIVANAAGVSDGKQ